MKRFHIRFLKPEHYFIGLLLILSLAYNYHQVITFRPVGIHQWRNCISAAFPLNFYHGGNFFTTQTNALLADNLSSDISIVEFPLIYFMISLFYRVFGPEEIWFRLFQILIGFTGLTCLFRASYYFTRDWFYAGFIPLIIFTSPIYVYYLNNFIPDATALSFTFIAFYFFTVYLKRRRLTPWIASMGFFALAALTKTSALLPYLAIGGVALLDLHRVRSQSSDLTPFRYRFIEILSYLSVLILVIAWYTYGRIYSDIHGGSVSPAEIRPLWRMDRETIEATLHSMGGWFREGVYHSRYFLMLSALVFVFSLFLRKKANRFLHTLNILVVAGAVCFSVLFFFDLRNHDYYHINNLFLFIPLYLTLFSVIRLGWPSLYRSYWMKLFLASVVLLLAVNAGEHMRKRYRERNMYFAGSCRNLRMYDIEEELEQLGITRDHKVYCTPDRSINISLYLMDRKGLTDYSPYRPLPLDERLTRMRKAGIEYLILGSREPYQDITNLDSILGRKIGEIGTTEIFKLQ